MNFDREEVERKACNHLTKLIISKIRDHKKSYDYLKWNEEWATLPATSDSVLKFIFGLKNDQEVDYFRNVFHSFMIRYLLAKRRDQKFLLKFFRFYMCLPVFEYGYKSKNHLRVNNITPFLKNETWNTYMMGMCNFNFKEDYELINDIELRQTMMETTNSETIDSEFLSTMLLSDIIPDQYCDHLPELEYVFNSMQVLLKPLSKLMNCVLNKPCDLTFDRVKSKLCEGKTSATPTDLALYAPKNISKIFCCFEFKKFPICPKYYGPYGTFNSSDLFKDYDVQRQDSEIEQSLGLHGFLREIICEMLSHKCNRGILTDSYTYIFLEVDLKRCIGFMNKYSGENTSFKGSKEIPINYAVKNLHSAKLTLRQTILDFINKSIIDEERHKQIQDQMAKLTEFYSLSDEKFIKPIEAKRYKPSANSKSNESDATLKDNIITEKGIIVPPEKFDILKHGRDYYSQVYSIETSYLAEFLKNDIGNPERVVIKIHDAWYYPSDEFIIYDEFFKIESSESDLQQRKLAVCEDNYELERQCYKILEKDSKFNSIAYDHDHLKLAFCCLGGIFRKGMTNIFKYIETQELTRDQETYQKAVEQLEIIHKNGIIHNDISEGNILYSKDGKVYIIDYSFSIFSTDKKRIERDKYDLKYVFSE